MKGNLPFVIICVLSLSLFNACKPAHETPEDAPTTDMQESLEITEGKHVYCFIDDSDSVILSLVIDSGIVSGEMVTRYAGKDRNVGRISGALHGDTLFGEFTFSSEG